VTARGTGPGRDVILTPSEAKGKEPSDTPSAPPALRPYQQECIASIPTVYRQGKRRLLVSLPTGTGKTVVFASFVRAFHMKRKLLVLAHRDELLEQARDKLARQAPDVAVTFEQGRVPIPANITRGQASWIISHLSAGR
jgi:superfamily II DNA or RNA helicase